MQIQPQATAALTQVASLIKPIPVAMLTTLNGRGMFDSRPMAPLAMDGAGALWFFTDLRVAKLALLKITPDAADCWDAPDRAMVRAVGMLASVVTGRPVGLGTHGSHDGLTARPA